jgi:predicted porin
MQVKLLAAALVASLPLVASAQSAVVIYGVADASVSLEDNGTTGRKTNIGSGNQSTNRFGFRGTEDLGNGLKAIFNVEGGYAIDTGAGDAALFGRRAVVGLEGATWGQITIGREYTPIASIAQFSDALGQGLFGTNLGAFGTDKLTRRVSNSVNYASQVMAGGLRLRGMYAAGEKTTGASNNMLGAGLEYVGANFSAGFAWQNFERVAMPGDDKEYIFGLAYKMDAWEVKGNRMVADQAGPGNKFEENNLGLTYTTGAHKLLANYKQNRRNAAKAHGYTFGYTYTLSKRTNLYASYAHLENNATGTFVLASAGTTITPGAGKDPSATTFGVRHLF